MKYKFLKNTFYACILIFITSSCNKSIEIGTPKGQLVAESVFKDTATAEAVVVGMYSKLANPDPANELASSVSMFNALSADEGYHYYARGFDGFQTNTIQPDDIFNVLIWKTCYYVTYMANTIIEGAGSSESRLPVSYQQRITAEAKFVRAFCYFYLVNEYGDVPLVLSTDPAGANLPRAKIDVVYDQIEKDLTEAAQTLPNDVTYAYQGTRTRPTSWTAKALHARVSQYRGKWEQAESLATTVIRDQSLYKMLDTPNDVFKANSREGLFQFMPGFDALGLNIAITFMPFVQLNWPSVVINNDLYNAYETGDLRKTAWTAKMTTGGVEYPYPTKYKNVYGSAPLEYLQVLRMAEQYLIRAEAEIHLKKFSEAANDINEVRRRAGLPNTPANNAVQLQAALERECRIEFACEWGHRWMDLKRWPALNNSSSTRADEVLSVVKGNLWQPTDKLYPLPQQDINANPNLKQNPGYTF